MTLNEILKENGLDEQAVAAVLEAMKANKIYTASEENLDIRYKKLKGQYDTTANDLATVKKQLEDLQSATTGHEGMQQQVEQLQKQLLETKIDADAKLRLSEAKAVDVGYMLYLLKEHVRSEGKQLEVDENDRIKDWDNLLSALQTQKPKMFVQAEEKDDDGFEVFEPHRLKGNDGGVSVTKERFMAMNYEERMALKQKNEKQYNELAK